MSRRPEWIPPRKEFSDKIKAQARKRAGHTCQYPGCDRPAHEVDHIIAEGLGGASSLKNAQILCGAHHKQKSALDAKMIAKSDRQGGRSGQYARRKRKGSKLKSRNTFSEQPKQKIPQRHNPWNKRAE